jgi:hypothetical protein
VSRYGNGDSEDFDGREIRVTLSDRRKLVQFLGEVERILDSVVRDSPLLQNDALHYRLRSAWDEIRFYQVFGGAKHALLVTVGDDILLEHGLFGENLELKLTHFRQQSELLGIPPSDSAHAPATKDRGPRSKLGFNWIYKKAMEAMDILLDSIAIAVPALGVVKELKQVTEQGIDAIPDPVAEKEQTLEREQEISRIVSNAVAKENFRLELELEHLAERTSLLEEQISIIYSFLDAQTKHRRRKDVESSSRDSESEDGESDESESDLE